MSIDGRWFMQVGDEPLDDERLPVFAFSDGKVTPPGGAPVSYEIAERGMSFVYQDGGTPTEVVLGLGDGDVRSGVLTWKLPPLEGAGPDEELADGPICEPVMFIRVETLNGRIIDRL